MFTPPNSTLPLRLISIFILLIGLSISGCGDSAGDEALIEEEAEPLVVTIIDRWSAGPSVPDRSDAEILADTILRHETDDFYFDIPQRNQLVGEIESVLSLLRAAYPPMNEIHAEEDVTPGMLKIYLERDFYEIVKEMLQDKQGAFRFETGNADFDALNAKLGVQEVRWEGDIARAFSFYFDPRLNLRVASEAYSMVEGVRRVSTNNPVGISTDIKAFKQGETWYVIFWNGWGDCPAGCPHHELFCFTVTGTGVEMIPTAQAQTMPPFQELDAAHGAWSLEDATPFAGGTAHTWSWWDSRISDRDAFASADYNLGCSLFGEIDATPNQLRVSCGYRVDALPRKDRFLDNLDNYEFTGVVLLLIATQERTVIGNSEAHSTVVASETLRVAKSAAEIQSPENVYFENVLMPINPPLPSAAFERWWGAVHPTFVVCWDHPETGQRAYQVLEPYIAWASAYEVRNQPGCDNFKNPYFIQTLGVYLPRLGIRADIDEVLPRP